MSGICSAWLGYLSRITPMFLNQFNLLHFRKFSKWTSTTPLALAIAAIGLHMGCPHHPILLPSWGPFTIGNKI